MDISEEIETLFRAVLAIENECISMRRMLNTLHQRTVLEPVGLKEKTHDPHPTA